MKAVPSMPGSLEEALAALEADHEFLLAGDASSQLAIQFPAVGDAGERIERGKQLGLVQAELDFDHLLAQARECIVAVELDGFSETAQFRGLAGEPWQVARADGRIHLIGEVD